MKPYLKTKSLSRFAIRNMIHHLTQNSAQCLIIGAMLLVLLPTTAPADVLNIPITDNNSAKGGEDIVLPTRGMTMDEVSAQFGNPTQVKPPVGDPPITRWVYDKFTVHFEYNYVIEAVIHRK